MGDNDGDRKTAKKRQIDPHVEALIATIPSESDTRKVLEAVERAEAIWRIDSLPRSEPAITVSTTGSSTDE